MSETYTIENDFIRLSVDRRGAQMGSIVDKLSGREQLWQRDETVWPDSAPWLFPIVGRLKHDCYFWRGQSYDMPMHGFANRNVFELTNIGKDFLNLRLIDTEETRRCYPWRFELGICYRLSKGRLLISCSVANRDREEMCFSLGAHPGFLCGAGDMLIPEGGGHMLVHRLRARDHLLMNNAEAFPAEPIRLTESLFEKDAMIIKAPRFPAVTLRRRDGTGIHFYFGSVPWLGLWSQPQCGLRYVCVEPWFGVDDDTEANGEITEKTGIQRLPSGDAFTWDCVITCLRDMNCAPD